VWKWLVGIALILILSLAGGGYYIYASGLAEELRLKFQPGAKPTTVRTIVVQRGDLVRTVSTPGQVEPKTVVEVSAQVSARIIALPFREGQEVKSGDAVVRLDGRDLAALLDSAKAMLRSEEARLEGARAAYTNSLTELGRRRELFSTKDISKSDLDQAEVEYRRAESTLRVAEHAIDIARANILRAEKDLENTTIRAPFDGVITKLNAEVGETVVVGTLNNPGSVIMEIADLSVMLLRARVDEANIAPVRLGQRARVYVNAYPDLIMTGTVDAIGLKRLVDRDGSAYFETDIIIDKPEGLLLRSGLTANADIQVETFRDVIKVPSQAVVDRLIDDLPRATTDDNPLADRTKKFARVVFTVGTDGKARPVLVRVGPSDLTDTAITAGLTEEARVITGPFKALETLRDGLLVEDERAKPASPATEGAQAANNSPAKPNSP
jgi:HlyD family secretion protein